MQANDDLDASARAVLQAIRAPLPFDWALLVRFELAPDGRPTASIVIATYPGGMAGIEHGARWSPLAAAEQAVASSGEPSLCGALEASADHDSPLARLAAFGMRSRLQIPLFVRGKVIGTVALYSGHPDAFQPGDGLRLERLMVPFHQRLERASATADTPSGAPVTHPLAAAPLEPPAARGHAPDAVDAPGTPSPSTAERAAGDASFGPAERDRWTPPQRANRSVIEERLGALGEMVSGVAHELNNPLTAILGYAQILPSLEGFDRDRALTTIEQEALRASRIVRNLLAFARQHRASLRPVDVEAILRRVIDVRRLSLGADHVTVQTRFAKLRPVMADEYQLEQVFLNLLTNAHQAMQADGGMVTVATEQLEATARITISDTGRGVPDELAERIFEPFFTTRDVGTGVGLGLAIVYGIVAEHGGHVWMQPGSSGGAEFVIELPARMPVGESDAPGASPPTAPLRAETNAHVIVVDDEFPIRALTNEILSGAGYRVATAPTVTDAIKHLASEPFDAVIVDMGLPGIDAESFQRSVSERWPRLVGRLIWITDDPESDRAATLLSSGVHLEKPFDTRELLNALRSVLAAPV